MDAATGRSPLSWEPNARTVLGGRTASDAEGNGVGSSAPGDSARDTAESREGAASLSSNIFRAGIRGALREAANATLTNLDSQETAAAAAERHRRSLTYLGWLPVRKSVLCSRSHQTQILPCHGRGERSCMSRSSGDSSSCRRLSSAAGIDLQATAQWCEKALPYVGILLIVFVRQHIVGAVTLLACRHATHYCLYENRGLQVGRRCMSRHQYIHMAGVDCIQSE